MRDYIVRTWDGIDTEAEHRVTAKTPEDAMLMVERSGIDYAEAEVCDGDGNQLATFAGDVTDDGRQTHVPVD